MPSDELAKESQYPSPTMIKAQVAIQARRKLIPIQKSRFKSDIDFKIAI